MDSNRLDLVFFYKMKPLKKQLYDKDFYFFKLTLLNYLL